MAGYIGISSPSEAWADQWEMGDDWEVMCTSIFLKDIMSFLYGSFLYIHIPE
jgi:hypothetical protein